MGLRIIRESDAIEVSQLVLCFYGPPGTGKTSLAFTADDPLLIDFDKGVHRSRNRRDSVPVDSWEDVCEITASDLAGYKTVIVDTAGRALEWLSVDIIRREPKLGRGGVLSLQGFGKLKAEFLGWKNMLKALGKDIILVCHNTEKSSGDETVERLDAQGASKDEIYKCSDVMGRLSFKDGKRILNCSPTDTAFGKNPGQLPVLEVPDFATNPNYMGDMIRLVKIAINAQTAAQKTAADFLEGWQQRVTDAVTAQDFNDLVVAIAAEPCSDPQRGIVKRMIVDGAKAKALVFDVPTKKFKKAA